MSRVTGCTVLALYPTRNGFGFAVFVGKDSLIDWGVKGLQYRDKNFMALHRVKLLIERYQPTVLVIEDTMRKSSRRHERIRVLHGLIEQHAKAKQIKVCRFAKEALHAHFGSDTKFARAEAVVREIPMLAPRLPPKRKAWMSEDSRQSLFDAVALGIVYFATHESGG